MNVAVYDRLSGGASKLSKNTVVPTGFEDYLTPENIHASPVLALLTRLIRLSTEKRMDR
jgi:hypothetical protein